MKLSVAAGVAVVLAAWFGLGLSSALANTDPKALHIVQESCMHCHGKDGEGARPTFPYLAGQNAGYLESQLRAYRSGQRKHRSMAAVVEELEEDDFRRLARHYAALPLRLTPVRASSPAAVALGRQLYTQGRPAVGVADCVACHGAKAQGSDRMPRLAGQHPLYLQQQLRAFDQRERGAGGTGGAGPHPAVTALSDDERKALAEYIAGLQ